MSVRWKIVGVLIAVTVLYAVIDNLSLRYVIARGIAELEREEGKREVARALSALAREQENLAELAAAHAEAFAQSENSASEFSGKLLASLQVQAFLVCREDGSIVQRRVVDPSTGQPIVLQQFPGDALSPEHPALRWVGDSPHHEALAVTDAGLMVIASRRVERAPGSPALTVILGRIPGVGFERELELHMGGDLHLVAGDSSPELMASLWAAEGETVFDEPSPEKLRCSRLLPDWNADESILLQIDLPRRIASKSAGGVNYALLSSVATALVLLLVLVQLLERSVIRPISRLQRAVTRADDRNGLVDFDLERNDELGQLGREFDAMLRRLAELRSEASRASRKAGMSEIATSVLHEVGNVLNSVTVSAGLIRRQTQELATGDLTKVAEVLEAHAHDLAHFLSQADRGQLLIPCLRELGKTLASQRSGLIQELDDLDRFVERIAASVRAQHSHAGFSGVLELTSLSRAAEEALAVVLTGAQHSLEVVREYDEDSETLIDRYRLLEILVIVLRAVRQDVLDSGRADKRMVLRVNRAGDERLAIEVLGNGVGIAPEGLVRLFEGGHGRLNPGSGLHLAANLSTELGGRLSAESGGIGAGMLFRLELPLLVPESGEACRIRPQPSSLPV